MAKIRCTRDGDALVITLSDLVPDHGEEAGNFIVHTSAEGYVVEVEVLDAREFVMGALTSLVEEREVEVHKERPCDEATLELARSMMESASKRRAHAEYQTSPAS